MTILELREKRAKAWEAAKAFLDSHRKENGILSAEDDAAYTKMEQEITDLGKEIAIRIIFNFLDEVELPEVNGPIMVEQTKKCRKTA